MKRFTGTGVMEAVAEGRAVVLRRHKTHIVRRIITDIDAEKERLLSAESIAIDQLKVLYRRALHEVGFAAAKIFEIHMMLIEDEDFNESVLGVIENQRVNAEYAVTVTAKIYGDMFAAMDDSYMRARQADVRDISDRVIQCLTHYGYTDQLRGDGIIIAADELSPSEMIMLDKSKVRGFVTAGGDADSHSCILAQHMGIPGVVGVGYEFLRELCDGDDIVMDAGAGVVIAKPADIELNDVG